MKKLMTFGLTAILLLFLVACGKEGTESEVGEDTAKNEDSKMVEKVLDEEDYPKIYSEPKKYKGYEVTQTGKVFVEPEYDEEGIYLQIFADPKNSEKNTILFYADPSFEIESNQYVKWTGTIKDEFKGENLMGGTISAPLIEATELEVVNYFDVMSPTLKTFEINETKDQHGFVMTLEKVELSEDQFRAYVTIENKSDYNINFYSFNTKVLAGDRQLEEINLYEPGIEDVQSEILPTAKTSGVIVFPSVESASEVKLYADGSSDNYEISIEPFIFEINLQE